MNTFSRSSVAILAAGIVAFSAASIAAQSKKNGPKSEAETIAEGFLKKGSDLFDAKNAAGLAATYTEDGEVLIVSKRDGETTEEARRGRAAIEGFYGDYFRIADTLDSENTVETARLIAPDVIIVHGRFRPDAGKPEWPFVQMRVKRGDRWLMSRLWLFLNPSE